MHKKWYTGLAIGLAASAGVLLAAPMPTTVVQADQSVDQVDNGDGSCTTTVAGWVQLPQPCHPRPPQKVRQCTFTLVGAALVAFGVTAEVAPAVYGAGVGCVSMTL